MIRLIVRWCLCLVFTASAATASAQRPQVTPAMAPFVREDAAVIALIHARVIDGTGAAVRNNQTLILRDGNIVAVGSDGQVAIPEGARVMDLSGKSVLPGLVQLHEHLWMYAGSLLSVPISHSRLLLAAGVTSIRTAGSYNPYIDLKIRRDIEAGREVGPWMDLTVYMDLFGAPRLYDADATRRYLDFWLDSGFTSVKAYGRTNAVALRTAIEIAHKRGLKVTGHLCGVTYAQAAEMGIDNIEHGFAMSPDFLSGPPPVALSAQEEDKAQQCEEQALHALDNVDPNGQKARALIDTLVRHKVAITSTLPALETLYPDAPLLPGVDLLAAPFQAYVTKYRETAARPGGAPLMLAKDALHKSALIERAFMKAGGLLVAGTDPATPSGGSIAGYASFRQLELMVEHGFTPLEAIRVATLNGATYLDRADRIGSIAPGKQADLMIVSGDPSTSISDIRNVETVFKQGIGYDPEKLRASVRGAVGLK